MNEIKLETLRKLCEKGNVIWSVHALERMQEREITKSDVFNAIRNGKIIEEYPKAFPYPACLVLGVNINEQILHVVCGSNGVIVKMITAYYPDENKFDENGEARKENNKCNV